MHKRSVNVHKNTTERITREQKNDTKITVLDIERENRLAKVTSLYSKRSKSRRNSSRVKCGSINSKQRFTAYQAGSQKAS